MQIETLDIEGPLLIRAARHGDARGYFEETWSQPRLAQAGFEASFEQDNFSYSAQAGVLRGLHYQAPPKAQGKLVTVLTGAIRDVVVDVREGSPTYGRHVSVELSEAEPVRLWAPEGFLHGFVTLKPDTRILYKVTKAFDPEHDGGVAWNDSDLAIDWGVEDPILSAKDQAAPRLAERGVLFPKGARW